MVATVATKKNTDPLTLVGWRLCLLAEWALRGRGFRRVPAAPHGGKYGGTIIGTITYHTFSSDGFLYKVFFLYLFIY
jgi:hypothetical protein